MGPGVPQAGACQPQRPTPLLPGLHRDGAPGDAPGVPAAEADAEGDGQEGPEGQDQHRDARGGIVHDDLRDECAGAGRSVGHLRLAAVGGGWGVVQPQPDVRRGAEAQRVLAPDVRGGVPALARGAARAPRPPGPAAGVQAQHGAPGRQFADAGDDEPAGHRDRPRPQAQSFHAPAVPGHLQDQGPICAARGGGFGTARRELRGGGGAGGGRG